MITLRAKYHDVGNKINIALMGIGIAKKYIESLDSSGKDGQCVLDSIESCAAAERALLEVDESLLRLKSLAYRFSNPDISVEDSVAGMIRENKAVSILIVEDELEVSDLVKRLYEKRGYNVSCAMGGSSAIAMIKENNPDIVLLDLNLNDAIDGREVLRFIRKEKPLTRCIVVTGQDDEERIENIAALSPDDILIKPVLAAQLDAKVSGLVVKIKNPG